ncbi:thioredoxin-like protein 1 [Trichonephila inaurata madagascariensis]|uniref:Thioredoxin-like protein 1 n=1 Tax=Trichonephila inaurata madagascariensis TaxID=2747483 RepID=A0A8X6YPV3_9ARAC|nr:thioredoxin-like protein 1 [Trichonephila inaurata madagascariensis]
MPTVVPDDSRFQVELSNAGSKLVVVDFTAAWCNPCRRIAPVFDELSRRYPAAIFLKVDVDQCSETATSQGVSSMPTFIFYKNKMKIGQVSGADATALEAKIKEFIGGEGDEASDSGVQGHVDLVSFISKSCCECLNDSDDHPFANSLTSDARYLESDCDEQLIMSYGFNQAVKLHSLKISAPEDNGPKTLKLFINQPRTLDFDQADSSEPVQILELKPEDLTGENPVPLRYVKFQNVQNLQIFVKDNQTGAETTRINHLAIIGSTISITNMSDFKRVAGKKGESH